MSKNKEQEPSLEEITSLLHLYKVKDNNAAEKLAISITQKFPNYQLGWKVLGAVLKNVGEFSRSLIASQESFKLNPLDSEACNNLANTLVDLSRLDEGEENYRKAIELEPNNYVYHKNLGNLLVNANRLEEAAEIFKRIVILKDDIAENHSVLGNILKAIGKIGEAEESYKAAIALEPENPFFYTYLALVQREFGMYVEAERSYRKTLSLDPKNEIAHYNLGVVLFEHRHYKEAASHFDLSNEAHSKSFELKCYYHLGDQSTFNKKFDSMVSEGRVDAVIGSLGTRSEIRYGIKKHNPFCNNPLKYVSKVDLNKNYDFKNIFVNEAKKILKKEKISTKSQGLLTNGHQTSGNLFHRKDEGIAKIKDIISFEIKKYLAYHKDSDEGIITRWPDNYSLHGWLISMKSGGKLASHMHDNGWLSGSVYINVPPKSEIDSGNLVVRIDNEESEIKGTNQIKSIDVVTGSLCIFPSSLLHHTIPFLSVEERIVLAFDVVKI